MTIGLVGQKVGMTRVFKEDGVSVPVTVLSVTPNRVTKVKTKDTDGYSAVQVTTGERSPSRMTKAQAGVFAAVKVEPGTGLWEFRATDKELEGVEVGGELTVSRFEAGQLVDVAGTSKGKGFAGPVKRHNFRTQDATHGNSLSHRAHGSTGQNQTPGRVFKGKKMAGHLGAERVSQQNLEVVSVDAERHLILVKGAVPGAANGVVFIKPAVKAAVAQNA